jgi:hypothetical protein
MSSLVEQFVEMVQSIERPGDFYMSGTAEIPLPGLEIDGVGPVALPLLPAQARQLMDVAEQAPYGKGDQTLVDLAVRRTRQIDAAEIRLTSKLWPKTLERIVERAKDGLGVTGPVSAELYKLLIYDTGSFFVSHRDSEKRPRMFGTLVIVLPGAYTGGELIIRHQGQEVRRDLRCDDMPLAALHLLAGIKPTKPAGLGRLYRLAVDHAGRRARLPSGRFSRPHHQMMTDRLP